MSRLTLLVVLAFSLSSAGAQSFDKAETEQARAQKALIDMLALRQKTECRCQDLQNACEREYQTAKLRAEKIYSAIVGNGLSAYIVTESMRLTAEVAKLDKYKNRCS